MSMSNMFIWNCQGASSNEFRRLLLFLLKIHKPSLLVLVEPHISGVTTDKVIISFNYPHSFRVEAEGFSGGTWVLWTECLQVKVLASNRQLSTLM